MEQQDKYITRKQAAETYNISLQLISWRILNGYYRTDPTRKKILLEDIYKCLSEPPQVGRPPKP